MTHFGINIGLMLDESHGFVISLYPFIWGLDYKKITTPFEGIFLQVGPLVFSVNTGYHGPIK